MKKICFSIILALLFARCDNTTREGDDEIAVALDSLETGVAADLPTEGINLILELEGEYLMLSEVDGEAFYEEPCNFNQYDVKIAESAEGSGEWELYWLDHWYPIASSEEKSGGIYITVDSEAENVFMFLPAENDLLWNFAMMGSKSTSPIVRIEALDLVKINSCTDASAIMRNLPTVWYQLSLLDGEKVIYEYCEEAPDGLSLGEHGESIEFWNGSDPYEILSMSKANNRITIVYMTAFREDTLYMHNFYGSVVRFGEGSGEDDLYVSEEKKGRYRVVKEECDEEQY